MDIYIPSVYFHTGSSSQWQCATKRKKRSCLSGAVTHDNTQLACAKHGRQVQRRLPRTYAAPRRVSEGVAENLFATSNPFHIKFFVDLLSFRLASGYNTMLHRGEREIERERDRARENQLAHTGARDLPPVRAVSDIERETKHPPPHQKRSKSFAARSRAQARDVGEGRVRGPAGASPAETGGQRWAGPSRGQTCSCGCCCGGRAGNYRGRFYVRRSSGSWSWCWGETATGCCPLRRDKERQWWGTLSVSLV